MDTQPRNRGAIRTALGTTSGILRSIDTVVQIAEVNLQLLLEEEMLEAEIARIEIAARRAALTE